MNLAIRRLTPDAERVRGIYHGVARPINVIVYRVIYILTLSGSTWQSHVHKWAKQIILGVTQHLFNICTISCITARNTLS